MKKIFILFLFIFFTFSSFKRLSQIDTSLLCKTWKFNKIESKPYPIYHYKVCDSIGDYTAYNFLKSGKLIIRQNISWCPVGESKIRYETVKGKWKFISDSIILLKHKKYGNDISVKYRITKLTEDELVLSVKLKNGL